MAIYHTAETITEQGIAYPYFGLDHTATSIDDLAFDIHDRFGLTHKQAENIASDIYKIIEN